MEGERDPPLDPSFYEGRFLVEITSWDCGLYLGLSGDYVPPEARFQGGLNYVRTLQIQGRVLAPNPHKDKAMEIDLSPFADDVIFGREHVKEVGPSRDAQGKPER